MGSYTITKHDQYLLEREIGGIEKGLKKLGTLDTRQQLIALKYATERDIVVPCTLKNRRPWSALRYPGSTESRYMPAGTSGRLVIPPPSSSVYSNVICMVQFIPDDPKWIRNDSFYCGILPEDLNDMVNFK